MSPESHSFWGRTVNPYNKNLVPGGSSGGTAALVALRGSCVAPGTDIGGSIRIPCAACGIYGMRPTSQTMPTGGHMWYQGGYDGIICSTGPMCNSARDVSLFFKLVMDSKPSLIDPFVVPQTWAPPDLSNEVIRVGVMMHDEVVMPHPPILRALEYAVKKLKGAKNIKLVPFKPYKHDVGFDIARHLFFPEGKRQFQELAKSGGEDWLTLTKSALDPASEEPMTAPEMFELMGKREAYRRAYSDYWNKSEIDVLLCPPWHSTAQPHDTSKYWSYTTLWNLVDYPGFVFPSGLFVDSAVDKPVEDFKPMSASDSEVHDLFDPQLMQGCSIALQLVARKYNDQYLISAQEMIEKAIKS